MGFPGVSCVPRTSSIFLLSIPGAARSLEGFLAVLSVRSIAYAIDGACILDRVSFSVASGEHVGIVGANGSGKSTLLQLIAGLREPTSGSVHMAGGGRIGYLPQVPNAPPGATVFDMLASGSSTWTAARTALERAVAQLESAEPTVVDLDRYADALDRFEAAGGWSLEHRIDAVRLGLGLGQIPADQVFEHLSGGQKTRVLLGSLLIEEPAVLLLDEPTNFLDLPALEWLEEFVVESASAVLVVSHDRRFLDRTVSRIIEVDRGTHQVRSFPGNYSFYLAERQREHRIQQAAYRDQQDALARTQEVIRALDQKARSIELGTIDFHRRKIAKGIARRATVQKRRVERELESDEHIERPESLEPIHLDRLIDHAVDDRRTLFALEGADLGPGAEPVLHDVSLTIRGGDRIAITGENGSGKTTLLRTILGELRPLAGSVTRSPAMTVGYLRQDLALDRHRPASTVLDLVRAAGPSSAVEVRNLLAEFHFPGDMVFAPVATLSAGERIRLELACMTARGANVLVFDEPTSHLDLPTIEQLESSLGGYSGAMVVVSHDRHFLEMVGFGRRYAARLGRLVPGDA